MWKALEQQRKEKKEEKGKRENRHDGTYSTEGGRKQEMSIAPTVEKGDSEGFGKLSFKKEEIARGKTHSHRLRKEAGKAVSRVWLFLSLEEIVW